MTHTQICVPGPSSRYVVVFRHANTVSTSSAMKFYSVYINNIYNHFKKILAEREGRHQTSKPRHCLKIDLVSKIFSYQVKQL